MTDVEVPVPTTGPGIGTLRVPAPIAAGATFANPWHDRIGRFADKGTGRTVRPVTSDGSTHRVTAADGTALELHDPEGRLEADEIEAALNGVADAWEMAPVDTPPVLQVQGQATWRRRLIDLGVDADKATRAARHTEAAVMRGHPETIWLNGDQARDDMMHTGGEHGDNMRSAARVPKWRYVTAHEFGHVRMNTGDDPMDLLKLTYMELTHSVAHSEMSRYGKSRWPEAHAEAFADWVITDGKSVNNATRFYDRALGWSSERRATAMAAAVASPAADDAPEEIYDTTDGAVYVYPDGRVEFPADWPDAGMPETNVQARVEFFNPWHDVLGRFAPKGVGKQFESVADLVAEPQDAAVAKHAGAQLVASYLTDEERAEIAEELNATIAGEIPENTFYASSGWAAAAAACETIVGLDWRKAPLGVVLQVGAAAKAMEQIHPGGLNYEQSSELHDVLRGFNKGDVSAQELSDKVYELTDVDVAHGAIDAMNAGWQQAATEPGGVVYHNQAARMWGLDKAAQSMSWYLASHNYDMAVEVGKYMRRTSELVLSASQFTVQDQLWQLVPGGAKTVRLYRGVTKPLPEGATTAQANPLSSWTTERSVAERFAGRSWSGKVDPGAVLIADVPIEHIVGIAALTGLGSLAESEVVVMGHPAVLADSYPYGRGVEAAVAPEPGVVYPDQPDWGGPDWIKHAA